jgi:gas vesicle protein
MFPFGFALGAVAGATAVLLFGPEIAQQARPVAKSILKAALAAMHEAQVRGAQISEAAEDLYAEAKSEVAADIFNAAMASAQAQIAAAQAKAAAAAAAAAAQARQPSSAAAARRSTKAARRRQAGVKRSAAARSGNA